MGTPQSVPKRDSSVGDEEDFGNYSGPRESVDSDDNSHTPGPTLTPCTVIHNVSQPQFLFMCTAGIAWMLSQKVRVQVDFELAELNLNVRSFQSHRTPLM